MLLDLMNFVFGNSPPPVEVQGECTVTDKPNGSVEVDDE